MGDARGMALDDLVRHVLPTMLGSMSKKEKTEAKEALPKKGKKKPLRRSKRPEMAIEEETDTKPTPRQEQASISIFELVGDSPSEKSFKAESVEPKKRRIAKKRPVRRKTR